MSNGIIAVAMQTHEPMPLRVTNGATVIAKWGKPSSFFVKMDGSLWAMGENKAGLLGDGTFNNPDHPIKIVPNGVMAVACGETFTIFLKDDGSLWGFGWSDKGELGDGTRENYVLHPKQIIAGGVVAIAAGRFHSVFIKNDGSLWGMGNNVSGQLGIGTENHPLEPVATLHPVEIVASNVVSVVAGAEHSLFIKNDGSLWAMGNNNEGQIGICTNKWADHPFQIVSNNVVAAFAGNEGSLFMKNDGSLWAMGLSWGSDYGEGIEFDSHCPVQILSANNTTAVAGQYYNASFKTCASIWATSLNNRNQLADRAVGNSKLQSGAVSLPEYDLITIELLKDGNVRLTYLGDAGVNYVLERAGSLTNPNWFPLVTNTAPSGGLLVITNTPNTTMNNFWHIRSLQ